MKMLQGIVNLHQSHEKNTFTLSDFSRDRFLQTK